MYKRRWMFDLFWRLNTDKINIYSQATVNQAWSYSSIQNCHMLDCIRLLLGVDMHFEHPLNLIPHSSRHFIPEMFLLSNLYHLLIFVGIFVVRFPPIVVLIRADCRPSKMFIQNCYKLSCMFAESEIFVVL